MAAAAGAALAAFFIGQALQFSSGSGNPVAFRFLGACLLCLVLALGFGRNGAMSSRATSVVLVAAGGAVVWQLLQLGSVPPAMYLQTRNFFDFSSRLVVFAGLAVSAFSPRPWLGRFHVPAAVAAFCWLGAWVLAASPAPAIDVFTVTNEAIAALLKGENPWREGMKFVNIYHHTILYGPGAADTDWIYVGYPYPPLSLLISAVGYAFGDMRWANLGSLAIAALFMAWSRGRFGAVAAMLMLTTPRVLFVLEQSWTDVYILALVSVTLWSALHARPVLPFVLGLMLVTKQYMLFLGPLIPLLFDPKWTRRELVMFLVKVAATGLLVNLPFLLMGPLDLLHSLTYSKHPFRGDSLSFLAATSTNGVPAWPIWIQLPLLIPVYALVWWRGPRGPAGFALACAAIISMFFAFSKHAFCNHHFLVLGLACAALAMVGAEAKTVATTD